MTISAFFRADITSSKSSLFFKNTLQEIPSDSSARSKVKRLVPVLNSRLLILKMRPRKTIFFISPSMLVISICSSEMLSIINLRSLLRRNFGAGLSALLAGGGGVLFLLTVWFCVLACC